MSSKNSGSKIIEVNGLVKRYGSLTAVDGISFGVEEGSFFAFLGPNGAGKSTTINVICTILKKDEGTIKVNGFEVGRQDDDIRRSLGVVFQNSVLDSLLTVRENIETRAAFYGIRGTEFKKRLDDLTEVVGLSEYIDRPYGRLSGGQRRRADVARALINTPKVLFLDEPTTGLDPQTRLKVWDTLNGLRKYEKTTVFLTTHYMEEAAGADHVAIIDHGSIAAQGTPARLKEDYSSDSLIITPEDTEGIDSILAAKGYKYSKRADIVEINVRDSMHALSVLKDIEPHISSFEVIKGNMDNVFMNITGHRIRGEDD